MIALLALGMGWDETGRRRKLADDSGLFDSFEGLANYYDFQERAFTVWAEEAERKATSGGLDARKWSLEAAENRRKAAQCARSKEKYLSRAALKKRYREHWWLP